MQSGVHLIRRARLGALRQRDVHVPEPWVGVIDLGRRIEGHLPVPPEGQPLGIVGLDALLEANPEEAEAMMATLRRTLHEGKGYFVWKQIPLVFLVDGVLDGHLSGGGPEWVRGGARIPLSPLFGAGMSPVDGNEPGWWWSPQLG